MFRTVPLSIIRSFSLYTQQWYMSYRFADIKLWKTPDNGQRNSPKHAEFYSKNKFEKLVHLVGFIIRIYVTVHTSMVYVTQVGSASSNLILLASYQQTCMTYTIAVCTVKNYWWWTKKCPKHVEFFLTEASRCACNVI